MSAAPEAASGAAIQALQSAIVELDGRIGILETIATENTNRIEHLSGTVEMMVDHFMNIEGQMQDVAEMAATSTFKGRKKVPQFKYWRGKRGRIPLTPIRRLMRFKKTPTQWLRFGALSTLQYVGAPALMISGVSMLITTMWMLWREIEAWQKRLKEIEEEMKALELKKEEIKRVAKELDDNTRNQLRAILPGG